MVRCSYVDTRAGQMHVMEAGQGAPLVLLHWFPLSGRMYEAELPILAALGWRAIALDTMGLGASASRPCGWSVEQHADCFTDALEVLGASAPVVLGGHMASVFAAELGHRPTLGVKGIVLDGGPFVEEAALKAIMDKMGQVPFAMAPQDDGAHQSFLWNMAMNTYSIFAPNLNQSEATAPTLYRFIGDYIQAYLKGGSKVATDLPHNYPMAEVLAQLTQPGVLLTSETEPLRTSFEPMQRHYGGPQSAHIFPGDHPLHDPSRAGEYAHAIHSALGQLGITP